MLKKEQILEYWTKRTNKYKERAVGYKPYEKNKFIFQYINTACRTLDYGCGIGVAASNFVNYLGVDIIEYLIETAKKENPDKNFLLLSDLCLSKTLNFDFEQFFTATVLQHNPDDVVKEIFKSVTRLKSKNITFSLYENSQTNAKHIKARDSKDYVNLLKEYFNIQGYTFYKHEIFNAEHTLTIVKV